MDVKSITLSESIIAAQSVRDIAERLSWAYDVDSLDKVSPCWLSRNQLLGQWAYHYCMGSDNPLSMERFRVVHTLHGMSFNDYVKGVLETCITAVINALYYDMEQHIMVGQDYPLNLCELDYMDETSALDHAVKIAMQEIYLGTN